MNDLLYIPSMHLGDEGYRTAGCWISLSNITHVLDYTDDFWAHEPKLICHFVSGSVLKLHGPGAFMVKNHLNALAGQDDQDDQDIPY